MNRGQALLVVLLSLAVLLTVVLSILSYTTTDIAVTEREEESFRAFSAAEAGVEQALLALDDQTGSLGDATFNATVSDFSASLSEFNYPTELNSGDTATIWFQSRDSGDNFDGNRMRVCWGTQGLPADSATTPAIEVSIYYRTASGTNVARSAIDPNSGRSGVNSFDNSLNGSCSLEGVNYPFSKQLTFSSMAIPGSAELLFARIRLLYNDSPHLVGVSVSGSGSQLPAQGVRIESVGQSQGATRKIEVFRLFPDFPSVLDMGVFSFSDIVKNP